MQEYDQRIWERSQDQTNLWWHLYEYGLYCLNKKGNSKLEIYIYMDMQIIYIVMLLFKCVIDYEALPLKLSTNQITISAG